MLRLATQSLKRFQVRVFNRSMSTEQTTAAVIKELGSGRYSACDVSDALLKLKVRNAGFLPDIVPIPMKQATGKEFHLIVAPISTVLFKAKDDSHDSDFRTTIPEKSNIPSGKHFTDIPEAGSVVLLQQPPSMICACLGDIMANRFMLRGIRSVVADGRIRDLGPIGAMVNESTREKPFSVWSKGTSTVGTGLEAQAWAVNVPLNIRGLEVKAGDLIVVDEAERGCVVIPQEKAEEVLALMPGLKDIDDKCVADVKAGVDVAETFRRHR